MIKMESHLFDHFKELIAVGSMKADDYRAFMLQRFPHDWSYLVGGLDKHVMIDPTIALKTFIPSTHMFTKYSRHEFSVTRSFSNELLELIGYR